jgi:iron(III) transport system ATP-binding protein
VAEPGLVVAGVVKSYGAEPVLCGADLTVPRGSLTAVLGPSGCGKTTLLRVVAGFERLDAGTVTVGGRLVAGPSGQLPPERRHIGIVPQEGALFPHLSVEENVAFGLRRGDRRGHRVREVLELVGLQGLGSRMPHELSGGQQQRVAVARALAPRPALVLLDEPFSALDASFRGELRADVRAALAADGATGVLVTHDRTEALSTADLVAVLRDGRVVQAGAPAVLYREPVDLGVARFVGDAVVLPGATTEEGVHTALGPLRVSGPTAPPGTAVRVLLRPEQIRLGETGDARGTVRSQVFSGADSRVTVLLTGPDGGREIDVRERSADRLPGAEVRVGVVGAARVFPVDGEEDPRRP